MNPHFPSPFVVVRNITKRYGNGCPDCLNPADSEADRVVCPRCRSVIACRDVSFELFPGEVLGVVGESGSGKSTLIKMLNFDLTPTGGEFYMDPSVLSSRLNDHLIGSGQNLFALSPFLKRRIRNAAVGTVYQHQDPWTGADYHGW